MRPSPWKRRLVSAVRWSLLFDALVSASAALLTTFPWPVWTSAMGTRRGRSGWWSQRSRCGSCRCRSVLQPRRCGSVGAAGRWLTGITVALCVAAAILLCKPAVQAWQLGRTLDATLDAAFGVPPVPRPCPAFSLAAVVVPRNPAPVAIETMQYADGLTLDFYRPPAPPATHPGRVWS